MPRVRAWQVLLAHACVAVALAGPVRADNEGLLAKARAEFDALSYSAARTTLSRALATGNNQRGELAEIYRMSGFVAGALGDAGAATEAFKRWLALTPDAALDQGTSPKIAGPFAAAKAFFEKREPLKVTAETNADPPSVTLVVGSDPAGMVKSARVVVTVDDRPAQTLSAATAPPITFPLPPGSRHELRVIALDEHGNQLVEIDALMTTRQVKEAKRPEARPPPPPPPPGRALYARAWLWGGIAVAAGATGAYFGLEVRSGGDEIDALKRDSANHTFGEARAIESRMRRDALIANIGFGVAGASAIVAGYLFLTRPAQRREQATTLAPVPLRDGAGVTLTRPF
jgi:hypothetical protein